jgi:CO dehydrogenase maturation factor
VRIAIAGKGGAGKTTLAATLARSLARRGAPTVAIDADSNPNLAPALGVPPAAAETLQALPTSLVSRKLTGPALAAPLTEVLDQHALTAPDSVRLVRMGMPAHAEEGCMCAAHATVSALLADLGGRPEHVTVVDMEASPEHFSRGTTRHVDVLLLVTEPYYRSLETVRRMALLARELPIARLGVVGNKVRAEVEEQAITEFAERHDLDLLGMVPWRDAVVDADLARVPLIDHAPDDPAVAAVGVVAERAIRPGAALRR